MIMTQDLLDRNNNACFDANIKKLDENKNIKKKNANKKNNDPFTVFHEQGPKGIVLYNVASSSSAQAYVNEINGKAAGQEDKKRVAHAVVGPGEIIQCLPWSFKGSHSVLLDNTHLAIEVLYDTTQNTQKTYETALNLCAFLCNLYNLAPAGSTEVITLRVRETISAPVILSGKEAWTLGEVYCKARNNSYISLCGVAECPLKESGNCFASDESLSADLWGEIFIENNQTQETNSIQISMDDFRNDLAEKINTAKFFFVTKECKKEITLGKALPEKAIFKGTGKTVHKVGSKIETNYPLELAKIDPRDFNISLPKIDPATEKNIVDPEIFIETYPAYKQSYRAASDDLYNAAVIAATVSIAEKTTNPKSANYSVFSFAKDTVQVCDASSELISDPLCYGLKIPVLQNDIGASVSDLIAAPADGITDEAYTFTAITNLPANNVVLVLDNDNDTERPPTRTGIEKRVWEWKLGRNTVKAGKREAKAIIYSDNSKKKQVVATKKTSFEVIDAKNETMLYIGRTMLKSGYVPAFVAGMMGNISDEGSAGKFESSFYTTNPSAKPAYLKYMEDNHNYAALYSDKYIFNKGNYEKGIKLSVVLEILKKLEKGNWEGKFGLGCIQWTGNRTISLLTNYIEKAAANENHDFITFEQTLVAEGGLMIDELEKKFNKYDYGNWLNNYKGDINTSAAAEAAADNICRKFVVPLENIDAKAKKRAEIASKLYVNTIPSLLAELHENTDE